MAATRPDSAEIIHELRNPLSAITYAAELQAKLLKMTPTDLEQLQRTVEIILKSAKDLQELITDLRDKL